MKKHSIPYLITAAGLILLAAGLLLIKIYADPQGMMRTLPYVCIGIGCGFFGHGMGEVINRRAVKNYSDKAKQIKIEKKDERNISISNRAKAKAYDLMLFVFSALMITFALMGVETAAVILFVAAYLFVAASHIYYQSKYNKEM